jgi:hypothetical protein
MQLSPISILDKLIELMPKIAIIVIDELMLNIHFHIGNTAVETHALGLEPTTQEDSECASNVIGILSGMLVAHRGNGDKLTEWMISLQSMITHCCESSKILRESVLRTLEKSFYFYAYSIDVPIVSEEQANQLEDVLLKNQEATLEILKSGKPDQLDALNVRKDELGVETDTAVNLTDTEPDADTSYFHCDSFGICVGSWYCAGFM